MKIVKSNFRSNGEVLQETTEHLNSMGFGTEDDGAVIVALWGGPPPWADFNHVYMVLDGREVLEIAKAGGFTEKKPEPTEHQCPRCDHVFPDKREAGK